MGREATIAAAYEQVDSGAFFETLARRIAVPTASSEATADVMHVYFDEQITPDLEALGYAVEVFPNPAPDGFPFLVGRRVEDPALPTVLTYGHADVVRGQADRWSNGRSPWELAVDGDRWYGRGTADNKAQHSIQHRRARHRARRSWPARVQLDDPARLIFGQVVPGSTP